MREVVCLKDFMPGHTCRKYSNNFVNNLHSISTLYSLFNCLPNDKILDQSKFTAFATTNVNEKF